MPRFYFKLGAGQPPVGKVEQPRKQWMTGRGPPVTWVGVQPYVQGLDEGLSVLGVGGLVQRVVPREQQLEHLARRRKRPVSGQKDVYVGRFQFSVVVCEALHQTLHRTGFQKPHPHRLPF